MNFIRKNNSLRTIIFFALAYIALYPANLTKFVFGGDSAEIVSSLYTFGVPHPPGYPLLAVVGNIFVRIVPILNIYQRLSLLNSLFSLGAAIMVFLILKKITKKYFFSFFSSLFFMVLFPVWLYSLVPEVFSLAILLISIQIYCLVSLIIEKKGANYDFFLTIFFLTLGLSVSHHHIFVFFLPGYAWLLLNFKKLKNQILKKPLKYILTTFSGMLFYIYPPIVSWFKTPLDIENAQTLQGFINLITRASYGTFKAFPSSGGDMFNRFFDTFSLLVFIIQDFKPIGIFFIALGTIFLFRKFKKIFTFLSINLFSLTLFYFYSNFYLSNLFGLATYERFLTFLYLNLIIFLGTGVYFAFELLTAFMEKVTKKNTLKNGAVIVFHLLLALTLLLSFNSNYKIIKYVGNLTIFDRFGQDILSTPEKKSVLVLSADNSIFISQNLFFVQKKRSDLTIITPAYLDRPPLQSRSNINKYVYFPKKSSSSENDLYKAFLNTNFKNKVNIYSDKPFTVGVWIPYGLLWKYYPDLKAFNRDRDKIVNINQKLWRSYKYPEIDSNVSSIMFTQDIAGYYSRQIWATINYYIVNNQFPAAKNLAWSYFARLKNDYHFLLTFINLNIYEKKCNPELKDAVNKIRKMKIQKANDYLPIMSYYSTCEKNAKIIRDLEKEFTELKKTEDVSLDKL